MEKAPNLQAEGVTNYGSKNFCEFRPLKFELLGVGDLSGDTGLDEDARVACSGGSRLLEEWHGMRDFGRGASRVGDRPPVLGRLSVNRAFISSETLLSLRVNIICRSLIPRLIGILQRPTCSNRSLTP
jgi:hypothetical protein